jgi:uncharacterized protein YjbJ (UPF0337 family)
MADARKSEAAKKTGAKATAAKGRVKKTVGKAAGNPRLEAEGRGDQAKGNLKQAGQKAKDAFKK